MRTNSAMVQARITEVYRLLLAGADRRRIHTYCKLQKWGVSDQTIDVYTRRALEEITKYHESKREAMLNTARNRLENHMFECHEAGDRRTFLQTLKELNEINGLHTEHVEQTVSISDTDEIRRKIDEAIAADPKNRERITAAFEDAEET